MILRVCEKISLNNGWDVSIIRVAFVLGLIFMPPITILIYLILGFIL